MKNKGFFIVIEGVDGAGKSTQAKKLAERLEILTGTKSLRTAEPFILRELILGKKDLSALSELLLFLADRAEHVNKIISPALEAGNNVVCERYNDSTLAYQAGGHEIKISKVKNLIDACNFPEPDAKIFLDLSPETAFSRVKERGNKNDKFEAEGLELIKKVSDFYKSLDGFITINCDNKNEEKIFDEIISNLEDLI